MFDKLREKLFGKESEEITASDYFDIEEEEEPRDCSKCKIKKLCKVKNNWSYLCDYDIELPKLDKNLKNLLIIDDNEGMVSFLKDDIEYLIGEGKIDKVNVIAISSPYAAFSLKLLKEKIDWLVIDYAIIDITLGGSIMSKKGNIKYTGVDAYEILDNNQCKYMFYTGNNLNPYIKANRKLIEQFKELTNEDIMDYVLFKTSLDMDTRREKIRSAVFGA